MIQLDSEFTGTTAAEGGQFTAPTPGGYVFVVTGVSEKPSARGDDMVTLELDIAEGEFQGAFQKFPRKVFQRVNGESLPYFKGMLNHFKASNSEERMRGVINQALQFDAQKLKGLRVGGCLREAEYQGRDGVAIGSEVWFLCPTKDVPEIKVPAMKKLSASARSSAPQSSGFANSGPRSNGPIPEDDLPF